MSDIIDELWKARHSKYLFFLELVKDCEIKVSKENPSKITYFMNDKLLIEYCLEPKIYSVSKELIWDVLLS